MIRIFYSPDGGGGDDDLTTPSAPATPVAVSSPNESSSSTDSGNTSYHSPYGGAVQPETMDYNQVSSDLTKYADEPGLPPRSDYTSLASSAAQQNMESSKYGPSASEIQ